MLVARNYEIKRPAAGKRKKLCILGSTGSIGSSTLEVVRKNPERFEVLALVAGSNEQKLSEQVRAFAPRYAALASKEHCNGFLASACQVTGSESYFGLEAICSLAAHPEADVVVAGVVGVEGLRPVLAALQAGRYVALANKESLVAGGALVQNALAKHKGLLVPVDSEHSALFQLLEGHSAAEVNKVILTASGGPFLDYPLSALKGVTPEQAIKHPRWKMGAKISVDSATLVNKALEVMEAHWLFNLPEEKIEALIHPQSIVHGAVEFYDGTVTAHLSVPDMQGPIAFALGYPEERICGALKPLNLVEAGKLEFRAVDHERFPAIKLARRCLRAGGSACAVYNLANELAVRAFLQRRIGFCDIFALVERALESCPNEQFNSIDELLLLQAQAQKMIEGWISCF
jgi:1-deoxy-D-xylulose-5-phosphate reductoisomerase